MKNDRDNYLLPRWHQDTKKGKYSKKWKSPRQLLVVLHLLIIVGCLVIIIVIVVVGRSTKGAYAKGG
jgi:hypothetical protein